MILLNFTGLKHWYFVPRVRRESDHFGLWYVEARWVGVEVVFYSRRMGGEFIRRLNAFTKETVDLTLPRDP